jgi:hypothetical protein
VKKKMRPERPRFLLEEAGRASGSAAR